MANTNSLKIVEKEIIHNFSEQYNFDVLQLSTKKVKYIFNEMEPDLIGYDRMHKKLYIGEITTSGYLGQRGKDFHVGAVRKVFEAFSKFYLIHDDLLNITKRLNEYYPNIEVANISCHFIVPDGSRFINALGYRARLFEFKYMKLDKVKLSAKTKEQMIKILQASNKEMKK